MSAELGRRIVVDASVVLKLFAPDEERHADVAVALLKRLEDGHVTFVAPELLQLEMVNISARKWLLERPALLELVRAIHDLRLELVAPDLERVVHWSVQGLSGYDM